ncbi:MAG TPA: hypothetical protein VFY14_20395 [Streptomyces sp.]|nr:hypothetical protein [Streptomyces sp.]
MKVVSDALGHSDPMIMRDICQSVLPHMAKGAAETTAGLVPLQRRTVAEKARKAAAKAMKAKWEKAKKNKDQGRFRPPTKGHDALTVDGPDPAPRTKARSDSA